MVIATTITQIPILRVLFFLLLSLKFHIMVQPHSMTSEDNFAMAKNYLEAFGYLAKNNDDSKNRLEDIESATRKFQEFYKLNVSGKLDTQTIKAMSKSRCGVRDENNSQGQQQRPTWPPAKRHLTYTFIKSNIEVNVSLDTLRNVFQQAFSQWSQVSSFTFAEVENLAVSDLMIGFYRGNHGDGFPFDGPGRVVAHSFPPTDGRLHYDGDEEWSSDVPPPDYSYDLVWVAIHEIGHLLGLKHSNDPNAIMYAIIEPGKNKRTLNADDVAAIKALYPHP